MRGRMLEIKYVEWGLSNRFNDRIELNINLLKYPKLHDHILAHEYSHLAGDYGLHDFLLDINEKFDWAYLKFLIKYPKALVQFIPVWYYNKRVVVDPMMLGLWVLTFLWVIFVYLMSGLILR